MSKTLKIELIHALAEGGFVSGQALAEKHNVSRAAISKNITSLIDMGLDIFSVTGKGYKLANTIDLLSKEKITAALPKHLNNAVETHNIIDSTNSYLIRKLPNQIQNGQVCLAEYQSAGRGRRGRQWISPFGSQLYLSMYWHLEQGMSVAMGLNIVAALAISDAINALYNVEVQLKWPNDIYLGGVKLAGILIDLDGQALEPCHCVIGIGLNLAMPEDSAKKIDQAWTDLQSHTEKNIDRNLLAAKIIECLTQRIEQHLVTGLADMIPQWQAQDYYHNKSVKLIAGERITSGICRGINTQGALLLEVDGKVSPVYGGEVSLRSAE